MVQIWLLFTLANRREHEVFNVSDLSMVINIQFHLSFELIDLLNHSYFKTQGLVRVQSLLPGQ